MHSHAVPSGRLSIRFQPPQSHCCLRPQWAFFLAITRHAVPAGSIRSKRYVMSETYSVIPFTLLGRRDLAEVNEYLREHGLKYPPDAEQSRYPTQNEIEQ